MNPVTAWHIVAAILIGLGLWTAGPVDSKVLYGSAIWGGARSLGLGEGCGAVMTDTESVFQTPAGVARTRDPRFVLGHTVWGEFAPTETLAGVLPLGNLGTAGFAGFYQRIGDVEERDSEGNLVRMFTLATYAGTAVYALPLKAGLAAGISAGLLDQEGGELGGTEVPVGAGLQWQGQRLSLGLSGMDLLSEVPRYQVSGAYSVPGLGKSLLVTGGGIFSKFDERVGLGVEFTANPLVALRAGYMFPLDDNGLAGLSNVTAGVGLRYTTMGIDYAFLPLGDMGQVHRFQVEFRFSGQPRTIEQAPATMTAPAEVIPAEPAPEPAPEPPKKEVEVEFVVPAAPGN